jgi:GntP family gluconate:H+ symporter
MIDPHSIFLLVSTLIAVIALILLISVVKLNPFLTLFLISLSLAMVAGMPLGTVIHS